MGPKEVSFFEFCNFPKSGTFREEILLGAVLHFFY